VRRTLSAYRARSPLASAHREALLEPATKSHSIQRPCERNCGHCFIDIIDDEASDAVVRRFRHRATAKSNYRRTIAIASMTASLNARAIDRKQECANASPKNAPFSSSRISTNKLNSGSLSSSLILVLNNSIDFVDLCRDRQRQPGAARLSRLPNPVASQDILVPEGEIAAVAATAYGKGLSAARDKTVAYN